MGRSMYSFCIFLLLIIIIQRIKLNQVKELIDLEVGKNVMVFSHVLYQVDQLCVVIVLNLSENVP